MRFVLTMVMLCAAVAAWAGDPPPHVVLISLDTTRTDALSCYGRPADIQRELGPVTPRLDALAQGGVRFERFYAHASTTLNSHTSMMTGRDPHQHGVPRNGYPVPKHIPTLAERLAGAGYDTIAVIGAMALEQPMGLDRGFRVYDDAISSKQHIMYQDRAEQVVDRALAQIDARPAEQPLFLFVHLYDLHGPFEAPEPYKERFVDPSYDGSFRATGWMRKRIWPQLVDGRADPADLDYGASLYLGEAAYTDAHVGRLLDELGARGLLDGALVVVTSDHGQVLSELPALAYQHGFDVSDGVTHIPLIMKGFGFPLAEGRVVQRQAEMAGLAPTIERLVGLDATLGQAHPFDSFVRPGPVWDQDGWPERPTRSVVMEATRGRKRRLKEGWNNLRFRRGIRAGGWTLFEPLLPSLRHASGVNSKGSRLAGEVIAKLLLEMLIQWDQLAPPFRTDEMSDETVEALRALGYLDAE